MHAAVRELSQAFSALGDHSKDLFSTIKNYVADLLGYLLGNVLGISLGDLVQLAILGAIVIVVQTLVFSLLTSIYIGLATEHEEHH